MKSTKFLTDVDLFYYQRMQFLRYVPHTKSEVIANRNMLNVTDTLIKSLEGGFLKLESAYGSSFVSVLPVGRFSTIFNGFHLGELVQRMSFPVELRFQAEFIDKTKLGGTMGRSNTRYDQIMNDILLNPDIKKEVDLSINPNGFIVYPKGKGSRYKILATKARKYFEDNFGSILLNS